MNDKAYIHLLEKFIFSEGYTHAELMAFVVTNLNQPKPNQIRRERKFKK